MQLLRFTDLKARGIVSNRVTLGRWIKDLGFPSGTLIGPNTRAWSEVEVDAWLSSRGMNVAAGEQTASAAE